MEESKRTYAEIFQEAVPTCFSFLVSEYGFSMTKKEDWLFEANSQYAYIDIFLDRHQVFVTLRPVLMEDRHLPEHLRRARQHDVSVIVTCLDPQERPEFKRDLKPEEIPGELAKYASLLKKYCAPMLNGDLSDWPKVKDCLEKRNKVLEALLFPENRPPSAAVT